MNELVRELIEKWRKEADDLTKQPQMGFSALASAEAEYDTLQKCANELEKIAQNRNTSVRSLGWLMNPSE